MAKQRRTDGLVVGSIVQLDTRPAVPDLMRTMETDAAAAAPSEDALETLSVLAERAEELRGQIEALDEQRKGLSSELNAIEFDKVPSLMDAAGVSSFRTRTGLAIDVSDAASCTLGKGRDESEVDHAGRVRNAFAWLRKNEHDGIIKRTLTVALGKGADQTAEQVADTLRKLGVAFEDREEVHTSTLGAFVREQLARPAQPGAQPFPKDLFRVSLARVAKIKRDRPRKGRSR